MRILNAKFRIVFGQVGFVICFVMLAYNLGLIPDRANAVREGRTALAEAIAVHSTTLLLKSDIQLLESDFRLLGERNSDLVSLALRRQDGQSLIAIGNHDPHWQAMPGKHSTDTQMRVPIWAGDHKWGQLELRFKPLNSGAHWGVLENPLVRILLFMGVSCFAAFYFYIGKVLRHLDPSNAVPKRVRAALDTLAEGLLVLDRKEQIVLANQAFAAILGKSPDKLLGYRTGPMP
jgi:PAS domain-containing protein